MSKYMTINNRKVAFDTETNLLSVIRNAGFEIPTFCYHSELSTFGACRMCVVEDDRGRILASCSEQPREGMVIFTNTPKLQHHRRMILELLLASHDRECTTCRKAPSCQLLDLAYQLGVMKVRFDNYKEQRPLDLSSDSVVINTNKCILCGDCIRTCEERQGVGALDFAYRGSKTLVAPAFLKPLAETDCVGCGQCRVVCPTGAITINTNVHEVSDLLADPNVRVIAQIAPAVRVAIGDRFRIPKGENSLGKTVAAMRRLGFDEIYDTNMGADLTVIEEAQELLENLENNEHLPMFTSCCPAWVKYCENKYPEYRPNVSTCRSPMEMLGAVLRKENELKPKDKKKIVVVAVMPCTAKKGEIKRSEHYMNGKQIIDYVLTTTELIRMIKEAGMDLKKLPNEALDMPFGLSSGGGAIFGVSGGVTEAVLRNIMATSDSQVLEEISLSGVRGYDGLKEATINYKGRDVKIAIVNGLKTAGIVIDRMKAGEVYYDFIEVMACKRGCIAGGGQPLPQDVGTRTARTDGIYDIDTQSQIKVSKDNPVVSELYHGMLQYFSHDLLHNPHIEEYKPCPNRVE